MGGRSSRRKGHDFERKVANYFKPIFPTAQRRPQGSGVVDGADVEGTAFWLECKRHEKVDIKGEFERELAKFVTQNDPRPFALVHKDDHGREYITFDLQHFLRYLLTLPF